VIDFISAEDINNRQRSSVSPETVDILVRLRDWSFFKHSLIALRRGFFVDF